MKKEKVYRYSLQFPGKTEEQMRAGELLEQLGSRKSRFIIRAINEYMDAHPDEVAVATLPRPIPVPAYSRDELRALLVEILAENGYTTKAPSLPESQPPTEAHDSDNINVDDMLENINVFLS